MALQTVIEQCCTSFLLHERFPTSYEELQPIPLLRAGLLSYAGDDGGERGVAVAPAGLPCPQAAGTICSSPVLSCPLLSSPVLSWLAQDRLPAILTAAAHLPALVRLRMVESGR